MGNFLQKINPFEIQPKVNLLNDKIDKPVNNEEEIANNNKPHLENENSFEEIIEEPEKQETIFNPSVDAMDLKKVHLNNKNNTMENLSKVLKIVEILKKNPVDSSSKNIILDESKDDVNSVRKDPRLKKKN